MAFGARIDLFLVFMISIAFGLLSRTNKPRNIWKVALSSMSSSPNNSVLVPTTRTVPPSTETVHIVVLVHGWLGNPLEQGYLHSSIENHARIVEERNPDTFYLIHSATCNDDKTNDGIAAGGRRLAQEVNGLIDDLSSTNSKISLSFVGNSLGGLYARYALSEISSLNEETVTPHVFWTTCTPHLGVSRHTYLPIPRAAEFIIAKVLRRTGEDLFRYSNVLQNMVSYEQYWHPLSNFRHRIAHVNAHSTDFQVPTATAGFVVDTDTVHHRRTSWEEHSGIALAVETQSKPELLKPFDTSSAMTTEEMATRLDAMGWLKLFCDVREHLPSVPIPFASAPAEDPSAATLTSREIKKDYAGWGPKWHVPLGHTILVANSKNEAYAKINAAGRPYMEFLAQELVRLLETQT